VKKSKEGAKRSSKNLEEGARMTIGDLVCGEVEIESAGGEGSRKVNEKRSDRRG